MSVYSIIFPRMFCLIAGCTVPSGKKPGSTGEFPFFLFSAFLLFLRSGEEIFEANGFFSKKHVEFHEYP